MYVTPGEHSHDVHWNDSGSIKFGTLVPDTPLQLRLLLVDASDVENDKLYVSVGDAGDDVGSLDPTLFAGKVLRINTDGSAPADNPFYDGPGGYIYVSACAGGQTNCNGRIWRIE